MWIIHEPKKVALWNKRHFEEKNGECAACLKYSVFIFVEKIYIKCNIWRVAVRPSYIKDARFLEVKLNSSTCFERNPLIIRRSTTQIVHMQPLVSSLSASNCLVQPLRKDSLLSGCTRQSLAESDDTRGCVCTICVVDLLMMSRLCSKHVEKFNLI